MAKRSSFTLIELLVVVAGCRSAAPGDEAKGFVLATTHRRSFTLIELLVVVAIIAVLVAVLLPALGIARERTQAVSCRSGLGQIGLGLFVYTDDSGGALPSPFTNTGSSGGMLFILGGLWDGRGYLGQPAGGSPGERLWRPPFYLGVLCCSTGAAQAQGVTATAHQYVSYGPSCFWAEMVPDWQTTPSPGQVLKSKKLHAAQDRFFPSPTPSTYWLLSEFSARHDLWSEPYIRYVRDYPDPLWEGYDLSLRVHTGGANFLFADGHVAWFAKQAIVARYDPMVQSYTRFQPEMR
jgi:prepilin-type processing-associated H-X9-DG protein/prepilin-type N-terminal cleavage/methylation domain-containing protein